MKLLLCIKCYDVFKLGLHRKQCDCGATEGAYREDGHRAWYRGKEAVPLGIDNKKLRRVILYGDRRPVTHDEDGNIVVDGSLRFDAWVFPDGYARFERLPKDKGRKR